MASPSFIHVLIAGAGPTGLVLAHWLTRLGVSVRLIDSAPQGGTTSRALAVQARTLELYRQVGLADEVVEHGLRVEAINLWVRGKREAHAAFGTLGEGVSPFPFALVYPQDEHERLLGRRLSELGVHVERRTEFVGFEETAGRLLVRLRRPDGGTETCETAYLAGCDGARSAVRGALGIGFEGGTYEHLFYVADVQATGPVMNGELHVALDSSEFLAVFPLKGGGARLVGTVRDDAGVARDRLSWSDVSKRVIEQLGIDVTWVNWFSTYRVHHRVADHFRKGRAFLLGDAAHIHSPVGGQGMNTGIGDAVNLAWKLAAVLLGRAGASLLDSYEPERIAFARRLVETTDRAFTAVTSDGSIARRVRLNVVPLMMPALFKFAAARRLLFRTVSQTAVNYRGSALSEGQAGPVRGGDRLPWVSLGDSRDNFSPLCALDWQVHVYGTAAPGIETLCGERRLPLHRFDWNPDMRPAGIVRDALYLVRPDGYVALAGSPGSGAALAAYLDARQLT
ncbi:MAG TPA: FAD-dependent monooxygenase [Steroidobacteraceae bacterium]|nr:FAD-dependent monooxygenase [Steroidobacteraceae bacterium]